MPALGAPSRSCLSANRPVNRQETRGDAQDPARVISDSASCLVLFRRLRARRRPLSAPSLHEIGQKPCPFGGDETRALRAPPGARVEALLALETCVPSHASSQVEGKAAQRPRADTAAGAVGCHRKRPLRLRARPRTGGVHTSRVTSRYHHLHPLQYSPKMRNS